MMTASNRQTARQHDDSEDQISELQRAVQENKRTLEEVQQKTRRAEDDMLLYSREAERWLDLMKEKGEVVSVLRQFGHLLQEEQRLSELLNVGDADRNDLKKRAERASTRMRSLAAEILEVKKLLAEARAPNVPAQALKSAPASKPRRAQTKRK